MVHLGTVPLCFAKSVAIVLSNRESLSSVKQRRFVLAWTDLSGAVLGLSTHDLVIVFLVKRFFRCFIVAFAVVEFQSADFLLYFLPIILPHARSIQNRICESFVFAFEHRSYRCP